MNVGIIAAARRRTAVAPYVFSGALISRATNATIGTNADITYTTEEYDTDNYFTIGTSAADLVAPTTDLFRLQHNNGFTAGSLTTTKSFKTGSAVIGGDCGTLGHSTPSRDSGASAILALTAADTMKLQNVDTSGTYGQNNEPGYTWRSIERLDAAIKYALVYPSASQSFSAGWNSALWDSEVADTSAWHSTGSNTERLTVPAGVTRVRLSAGAVSNNFSGSFGFSFMKNGTTLDFAGAPSRFKGEGGVRRISAMGPPIAVTPGDYFEMQTNASASYQLSNDADTWACIEEVTASIKACVATSAGGQVIGGSDVIITFGSEDYDDAAIHDTSSNTSRFTVPAGCTYARVHANIIQSSFTQSVLTTKVYKNGALLTSGCGSDMDTSSRGRTGLSTAWLPVTPGDYFEVACSALLGETTGSGSWGALECF